MAGVLKRRCALGKTPLPGCGCARRAGPATLRYAGVPPLHAPDRAPPYAHPARLILTLPPKHVAVFVITQLGVALLIQLFASVA